MTTASQIITDAYRQSNLISIGVAPTVLQETEGLRYLNRILKSTFGFEAGEDLRALPLGDNNITRPSGFPWWGAGQPSGDWYVPSNIRLALNLTEPTTVFLDPAPRDGARFAYMDHSNNVSTFPLTINGNGSSIEGSSTFVVDTDGAASEYMYRADLGVWQKYAPLELFDTFPFPEEFDDFFIISLAFRLNPAYERQLDPQSQIMLQRARTQIRARYTQIDQVRSELGLIIPSIATQDRNRWGAQYYTDPSSLFNFGLPWPTF